MMKPCKPIFAKKKGCCKQETAVGKRPCTSPVAKKGGRQAVRSCQKMADCGDLKQMSRENGLNFAKSGRLTVRTSQHLFTKPAPGNSLCTSFANIGLQKKAENIQFLLATANTDGDPVRTRSKKL